VRPAQATRPDLLPGVELCVLLLPADLERFELREQADDLLRAQGVVAVDPPRVAYAALGRLPELVVDFLAVRQARRLLRALRRRGGRPRVVVMFDALQYQLARAIAAVAGEPCELWYWRFEDAAGGAPKRWERRVRLHEAAAQRAAAVFVSDEDLEREELLAGRRAILVPRPESGATARARRALDEPLWQRLADAGVDVRVTR
jgi:hypothetical protein